MSQTACNQIGQDLLLEQEPDNEDFGVKLLFVLFLVLLAQLGFSQM